MAFSPTSGVDSRALVAPVATVEDRLRQVCHVALDMDGTIYNGHSLFESTAPFLSLLKELGLGHTFLTNNPSRSIKEYLAHLKELGIVATEDRLYTSIQATIEYLQGTHPRVQRVFVLGGASMSRELSAAGFALTDDSPGDEPDAVVVGFDTTLTYPRLGRAAWWIRQGKPWFATNPDRVCPTDLKTVLVDCGSICAALEAATGLKPTAVLGKPDPAMIRGILHRHGIEPHQLAMVGDRLYTDISMAHRAGSLGVLVLTGEATAEEAARFDPAPDIIVSGLQEFGALLRNGRQNTLLH
ncbi:MAG: HAD-IIA family hydrolase [Verrucomicrobia bacterium]|jgi:NagD protein|nr:HAD-IIA family hydrolase [Verrucomicrobiota bacterium]